MKDKGKLTNILDYGLATHIPVPIMNYEFDLKSNINYGGNEGIYLDLWIEYYEGKQKEQIKENNNTIRNLTGKYKKIEPDCRECCHALYFLVVKR